MNKQLETDATKRMARAVQLVSRAMLVAAMTFAPAMGQVGLPPQQQAQVEAEDHEPEMPRRGERMPEGQLPPANGPVQGRNDLQQIDAPDDDAARDDGDHAQRAADGGDDDDVPMRPGIDVGNGVNGEAPANGEEHADGEEPVDGEAPANGEVPANGELPARETPGDVPAPLQPGSERPVEATPPSQTDAQPPQRPVTSPPNGLIVPARPASSNGANGASGGITRADGGLVINFRDASIDVVLDELSEAAGFIVVKEVRPQGRVTLSSRQPVSPEDAVSLLNTVLNNAGYAAIQQDRILKIVARDQAKRLNIPVRSGNDPEQIARTDELITQVIPLRYADAQQLRTDLQPLINPQADFTSNQSSNALVITDTSANVRRVVEIISALDTSLADAVTVRVFQLKFANATQTAALINNVFSNLTPGGVAGGGQQGARGGTTNFRDRMRQQLQAEASPAVRGNRVSAAADDRTNSVVVTGSEASLAQVAEVIQQLDNNPVADENVFVFRLRNAQAANVESVVNGLFGNATASRGTASAQQSLSQVRAGRSTSTRGGTTGRGTRSTGSTMGSTRTTAGAGVWGQQQVRGVGVGRISPQAQAAASALAGQVTIIADTDTNSLLVRTNPTNYEQVRQILSELDRPVAQVLIKVLIAEVTHDDSSDLGAELSVLNLRASGNGQTAGTSYNIPTVGPNATGLVVQVLESDFQATIRALETEGKLDVLSRPYILASDNQLASITVGQEVPFITNSRITDNGGIINTTEYGDIGILLDVIPHINPDGLVILDVAPEISALTGTSVQLNEQVSQPIIAKRSAQSRVGVRDGQTIVIGGLMEDRKTSTVDKVPLLGDIPILGHAFKRTRTQKVKTELLIFLTPHVAFEPDSLQEMGESEMDGTKLVPGAVAPGTFQEHFEGMQRGKAPPTTRPMEQSIPLTRSVQDQDRRSDSPPIQWRTRPRQGDAGEGVDGGGFEGGFEGDFDGGFMDGGGYFDEPPLRGE